MVVEGDEMDKKVYERVILGATFFGAATALCDPANTLIVEQTGLIGTDFVDCFHEKPPKRIDVQTALGKQFADDLKKKGLLSDDGTIYLGPCVYVLTDYLKRADVPCLFLTKVMNIEQMPDGLFLMELYNQEGFSTVLTKSVLDTTSKGVLHNKILKTGASKTLNIIVKNEGASDSRILHNSISGLDTFLFPVEIDAQWEGMRQKIDDFWSEQDLAANGVTIAAIADSFAYTNDKGVYEIEKNHVWKPSTAYDNLLEAFDFGAREEI